MIGACMFSRATRRRRHRNNLCNSDRARRRMRARRRELATSEPRRYTSARITTPLYTSRGYRDAMTHGRTLARHTCITCVTCARHMSISIARRRESYEHRHSLRYNTHRRVVKCVRNQQSANRYARLSASSGIHRGRPRSARGRIPFVARRSRCTRCRPTRARGSSNVVSRPISATSRDIARHRVV